MAIIYDQTPEEIERETPGFTVTDKRSSARLQAEVEETIVDNAKIEAAFQNARDIVGNVIVPDEHDPRL